MELGKCKSQSVELETKTKIRITYTIKGDSFAITQTKPELLGQITYAHVSIFHTRTADSDVRPLSGPKDRDKVQQTLSIYNHSILTNAL